ncbi:MAG: CidA/LrgA family protein, partial [Duncaniella sp.]|nr:CidA/LrgA family protein [Duncaniella sp.]
MVKQCFIIFGCLAVGEIIVWLTGISIPGSILGMLLMTFLLEKKLLKVEDVA